LQEFLNITLLSQSRSALLVDESGLI